MGIKIKQYSNISKEEFDVEIVTPLFLGGAEKTKSEIRAASIKGAIRFWWRALYGYQFSSIEDMAKKEGEIFGSTDRKSSFSIVVEEDLISKNGNLNKGKVFKPEGKKFTVGIIDYLAMGIREFKKGYTREHIEVNQNFKIEFNFYNEAYKEKILNSFYALIKFGSLGAKARNGFGSLSIGVDFSVKINKNDGLLDFTAFSNDDNIKSRLFLGKEKNKWEDALSEIGMVYKDAKLSLEKKHDWKKRVLVALPIDVKNKFQPNETKIGRHTKPYFLHVNKLDNGKYQGQILFLSYKHENFNDYMNVHQKMCIYMANNLQEVEL